jgi:hypothetical protein
MNREQRAKEDLATGRYADSSEQKSTHCSLLTNFVGGR